MIRDNEEFSPPRNRVTLILTESKNIGCDVYLVLFANGLQAANFLSYAEEKNLLNTRGYFLLMHDFRILRPEMLYLWNRIINVVFIRRYLEQKRRADRQLQTRFWFDLNTVFFPVRAKGTVVTRYIDTWFRNRFRFGNDHFLNKTKNLRGQKLRVAIFEHIPAVTKDARPFYAQQKNLTGRNALGIEFEIMLIVANSLNFKPIFYLPQEVEVEKWGSLDNGNYTGLFREAVEGKAVFYLGDLHYTLNRLHLLDLSWPYNTECLTFLTPESLHENSWKLLILPFGLYTWIAVIFTLILAGAIFYFFSKFYEKQIGPYRKPAEVATTKSVALFRNTDSKPQRKHNVEGLYLFAEPLNSILYTYSMLLQVSLPTIPNAWSVRVFIGWWWIYSILVTVTYKASMTASLAHSINRVTIDTLSQLAKSRIAVGGWGNITKEFLLSSSDVDVQRIGSRFEETMSEEDSIARVANGTFSYFENIYTLRQGRVTQQILEESLRENSTNKDKNMMSDMNLHVMEECVVHMPISIGMDKNSPLKPQVDQLIKRIVEAGLVDKWLTDVMEQSKISEIREEGDSQEALIDFHKLQGALVALGIGYFLSLTAFLCELWHWKYIVLKNPKFDKYHMDLFYKTY